MRRIIGISLTISLAVAALAAAPSSAAEFGDINGDAVLVGDNTIVGTVTGNVTNIDGELIIEKTGKVMGNILQIGDGGVVIDTEAGKGIKTCDPATRVVGNIVEKGDGVIHVLDCSTVDGSITEYGKDGIAVSRGSFVTGNARENDKGNLWVRNSGTVEGFVKERGDGDVEVQAGSLVKGDAIEEGKGCILIKDSTVNGTVDGNLC